MEAAIEVPRSDRPGEAQFEDRRRSQQPDSAVEAVLTRLVGRARDLSGPNRCEDSRRTVLRAGCLRDPCRSALRCPQG